MPRHPLAAVLEAPVAPDSRAARWRAAATLHHAYFTGLILTVASRRGAGVVGEWTFRVFRRQHLARFLPSFGKLGLDGLPHAVAAARYHYLSNAIGGVEVEYMPERDDKAWVRFCHPRWLYEGTALCAVPLEVSHGFLRGWYGHNGVSLGNPRLGFVCTSQDMTAQYGFAGYFQEFDAPLEPDARVQFAPGEEPPPFDPALAPRLDPARWTAERVQRAHRNYAVDYVRAGLLELVALLGPAEAVALGNLAAQLVGRQFYRQLQALLGAGDESPEAFARFLAAMAAGLDDPAEVGAEGGVALVRQQGWALGREAPGAHPAVFEAWRGLWEGCLAVHDRFLALEPPLAPADPGGMLEWRIRRRRPAA